MELLFTENCWSESTYRSRERLGIRGRAHRVRHRTFQQGSRTGAGCTRGVVRRQISPESRCRALQTGWSQGCEPDEAAHAAWSPFGVGQGRVWPFDVRWRELAPYRCRCDGGNKPGGTIATRSASQPAALARDLLVPRPGRARSGSGMSTQTLYPSEAIRRQGRLHSDLQRAVVACPVCLSTAPAGGCRALHRRNRSMPARWRRRGCEGYLWVCGTLENACITQWDVAMPPGARRTVRRYHGIISTSICDGCSRAPDAGEWAGFG